MKHLIEKRNSLIEEMEKIVKTTETEQRAFNETETARFEEIKKEIAGIDNTIRLADETRALEKKTNPIAINKEEEEIRAFENYILGRVSEFRAGEQNVTMGNNGAIIPTTIANQIIKTVKDICPIFAKATIYNVKGTLKVPVWGLANTTHNITVAYQSEFTDITADSGKFTSVDLSGYLAGALVLIGESVENNGSFSVVNFVVEQMATEIAAFLEKELLVGTGSSAAQGAVNTSNTLTTASGTAITADELITLQSQVKQVYQNNACWIMNGSTFAAIKKLKDSTNQYLLQSDVTKEFPYTLLGKPVFLSDNMPAIALSAKTVLYGDMSGLSVNMRENISIKVLREKYATQHAIGINAWFEFDAKVTDPQRIAVLVQKAS